MYNLKPLAPFQQDLDSLDHEVARFVLEKVEWIAQNPGMARFPLAHLPYHLKGLQKYRIGDYRIFFWIDHATKEIILYRVRHRREAYLHL